jgi:hypothetical protein
MEAIRAVMNANRGDLRRPLLVARARGQLRLVIRCRTSSHTSWAMSVILYSGRFDGRIDCIDWEGSFLTIDGKTASGFHRHVWDPKTMNCEKSKVALPLFQPANVEDFILQGFALIGVTHQPDRAGGFIQ